MSEEYTQFDITIDALKRYRDHYIEPGSSTMAFLSGDLHGFYSRSSPDTIEIGQAIFGWCYNNLPSGAWGNPEKVAAWLARGGE